MERITLFFASVILSSSAVVVQQSAAADPLRPALCVGCSTEAQLHSRAVQFAYTLSDVSARLLITSDIHPISAFYLAQLGVEDPDPWYSGDEYYSWAVWPLTPGDETAKRLDNSLFHRKLTFNVPASVAENAQQVATDDGVQADVNTWIRTNYPVEVFTFSSIARIRVQTTPSDVFVSIMAGMVVTVRFADGSSAQFRWNGLSLSSLMWDYVQGSARGPDGQPMNHIPFPGGPGQSVDFYDGPDWFLLDVPMNSCATRSTVCTDSGCMTRVNPC